MYHQISTDFAAADRRAVADYTARNPAVSVLGVSGDNRTWTQTQRDAQSRVWHTDLRWSELIYVNASEAQLDAAGARYRAAVLAFQTVAPTCSTCGYGLDFNGDCECSV